MRISSRGRTWDSVRPVCDSVRAVCDPDNVEAEFAILVRSDLHHHGLGRLLLARLLDWLRQRGTGRIVGDVLHDNLAMRALMHDFAFTAVPSSEHGVSRFTLALAPGMRALA